MVSVLANVTRNVEQEKKMKNLKRQLESWRSFLVVLFSVLTWEKPWYPGIIVGSVTSLFLTRWYWDPSVLTMIGVIGATATLIDYFGPNICEAVSPPEKWTAAEEKKYEVFCESMVETQEMICGNKAYLETLKETKPKTFFSVFFLFFTLIAWIGYRVNNWIITYVLVITLFLLPGIRRHKLFENYVSVIFSKISSILPKKDTEKVKVN